MSLLTIAKTLIALGFILILIGGSVFLLAKLNIPLGRLPGDISFQRGNFKIFFPLATSIILSILLTIGLNIIIRLLKK